MDTTIIDKLDRARYNLLKWFAVGWAIWYGTFIIKDNVQPGVAIALVGAGLFGWIIWVMNMIRFYRLGKIVKSDEVLKEALNDELYRHNTAKSFQTGYSVTIFTIVVFIVITGFVAIPAMMAFQITLYIGVLSALIASLFYNRN
jgi:hypothetical protein